MIQLVPERSRPSAPRRYWHHVGPGGANHLVLSQKTVRNHVSNIFSKPQVANRARAIVRAREADLAGGKDKAWGAGKR